MSAADFITPFAAIGSVLVAGGTAFVSRRKTAAESQETIARAAEKVVAIQGSFMDDLRSDLNSANGRIDALTIEHRRCETELGEQRWKVGQLERKVALMEGDGR